MARLTYLIGATADGFIAGPGDEIDFYPTPEPYLRHLAAEYPETCPDTSAPRWGSRRR